MGTDHNIHIGLYVKARGPKWLGPYCPFDEWLEDHDDGGGKEQLSEMENNCPGPFKDGWRGWCDNVSNVPDLTICPNYCETGVWDMPPSDPALLESAYPDALTKLRESFREVEICYGVVYYAR